MAPGSSPPSSTAARASGSGRPPLVRGAEDAVDRALDGDAGLRGRGRRRIQLPPILVEDAVQVGLFEDGLESALGGVGGGGGGGLSGGRSVGVGGGCGGGLSGGRSVGVGGGCCGDLSGRSVGVGGGCGGGLSGGGGGGVGGEFAPPRRAVR